MGFSREMENDTGLDREAFDGIDTDEDFIYIWGMFFIDIRTDRRSQLVDITRQVEEAIMESGIRDGIALVYSPHTTAGITINENADPSVISDISNKLRKLIDENDPDYRHMEGNSDSHIKTSLVGSSEMVIIEDGRLVLGRWQGIFLAEFDGPRSRRVYVKVIGSGGM